MATSLPGAALRGCLNQAVLLAREAIEKFTADRPCCASCCLSFHPCACGVQLFPAVGDDVECSTYGRCTYRLLQSCRCEVEILSPALAITSLSSITRQLNFCQQVRRARAQEDV